MINILLGEPVPKDQIQSEAGLRIQTDPSFSEGSQQTRYLRIRSKFASTPGLDHNAEAKAFEKSLGTLIMLSKALNYLAKHILEELDVKAGVEQVEGEPYLVIDLMLKDQKHWERMAAIVASLGSTTKQEKIEAFAQSNFQGFFKLSPDGQSTKVCYAVNIELERASKDSIIETIKRYQNETTGGLDSLLSQVVYFLSLKKFKIEADADLDLWDLLPKEFQPSEMLDLRNLMNSTSMQLPLTTSMKKIAAIFKDKTVGNFELAARIDSLEFKVWFKVDDIYENFVRKFIEI